MTKPRIPTSSPLKLLQSTIPSRNIHPSTLRAYHSYEHSPPTPFPPTQNAILSASLAHVPTHGFTTTALRLGAQDAGYPAVSTNLFPRGAFDLVNYHLVTQRLGLRDRVQFPGSEEGGSGVGDGIGGRRLGVGAKVKILILERLWGNKAVMHRWQEALALMALPPHVRPSLTELSLLSDELWFLAGDTSVDTSWYTKRASLAAVYVSAELFMTQDSSRGFVETERFLERSLGDLRGVGTGLGSVGEWVSFTGRGVVNGLRSSG
ncbi:MAG: Ubiquinone biosynthesis protein coq9, mitochondrial, partial [Pleopsidium flavum]